MRESTCIAEGKAGECERRR